jgi:MYXO-CTERM domain-containing protein
MKRSRSIRQVAAALAAGSSMAFVLAWSPAARADVPPSCDLEASLITCAAADVGKPCQGGGFCYAVPCATGVGGTLSTMYKCDACPTVLPPPDGGCAPGNLGTACGDGGTCSGINSWCTTSAKFVCSIPAAAQPTGPPAGETGGAGGGGGSAGAGGGGPGGASATGGTTQIDNVGSSSGCGCAIGDGAPTAAVIAFGLIAIGIGLLAASRRRRAR